MADQVNHYSDQTSHVKQAVRYLNILNNYGAIYDTASSSNLGSLTTYTDLRVVLAALAPPAVHADVLNVVRDAIGDGTTTGRPGVLGRVSLELGSTFDTLISTASGQAAGSRLSNLLTALVAYTAPDTISTDDSHSFAMQV